jgi:all-trans-retinol 13,14-reductase
MMAMAVRGMPDWLAWGLRVWRGDEIERSSQRTLAQTLAGIGDAQLRAVLGARWGDYGAAPETAPLLEHALVTGAYNAGAFFPVGGPARFAQALLPALSESGGELRLGASLEQIRVDSGHVAGVVYRQGGELHRADARQLISTIGVINTAACLGTEHAPQWHEQVRTLRPGLSYLSLYLGFEGDIAAAGASAANVWVYESEHIGRVWADPAGEDAPALFVSFPSLKDPQSRAAPTAEVLALCDTAAFMPWLRQSDGARTEDYRALKAGIEQRLLEQVARHFPALMPMLRFHELSTPLTQRHFVRTPQGSMYGLEMDAQRLASPALKVRTPVPGLLLAGQDVSGAGIQAAAMSGLMAAAVIEPALLAQLGG